jgi:dihydrofolate synthase/folylpolyglutamate synthase
MASETLDSLLQRLTMRVPTGWNLGLDRITALLAKLGDPHRRLPPVIHIAGTNGKGSVTATCRAILEAAGMRVHVHTSPHLVRFNERYRIGQPGGGVLADDATIAAAILEAERVNAGAPITFFELLTVAAFLLFAEHPADVTLLEVGLGGRLDATNVIPPPLAAIVTTISFDHEHFLGNTLAGIAGEKAGIIKPGTQVVVAAPQVDEVADVLELAAAKAGAPLLLGGQDWTATLEEGRMVLRDAAGLVDLAPPRLIGRHQIVNAGTAIAALRAVGLAPSADVIDKGLAAVDWPARMQRLASGPLVARAPAGAEVWLDGGHNPGAGLAIADLMADLEERVPRPLVLIAGMLETKDPVGFFRPFAGLTRQVVTVPIPGDHKARSPDSLAASARLAGLDAVPEASVAAALGRLASATWDVPPRILICGSLYLAGEVLRDNGTIPA